MPSDYLIQIIHRDTKAVVRSWEPSAKGFVPFGIEKDLEDELASRIESKGVGLGRTTYHVITDLRSALRELLWDLKSQV